MRHSIAWPRRTTSSWRERQRLAGGDADPGLDDVDAGRHLGHAVLDLHARVHLQEVVLPPTSSPSIGAGAAVVDRARRLDGDRADPLAHRRIDDPRRRRGLLDQLLVAALHRAVALAEVDDVAVGVGHHLDLDVARIGQVALEVDRRVAEEALALARGALEGVRELVSERATRRPLPPPPPEALIATG